MKKIVWLFGFLMLGVLLGGCLRPASSTVVDIASFTSISQTMTLPQQASVEASVTWTPSSPSETPSPTPPLTSETEATLGVFPLYVGSAWVYDYLGFEDDREISWQVVETVVETQIVDGYYAAKLKRTVEVLAGDAEDDFLMAPRAGVFWYLVDGGRVYRFGRRLNTDLSAAWLAVIYPFPEDGEGWYPDPDRRFDGNQDAAGLRIASAPFDQMLPTGNLHTCYNLATRYPEGVVEQVFCERVGFVFGESKYEETSLGYWYELLAFSLQ